MQKLKGSTHWPLWAKWTRYPEKLLSLGKRLMGKNAPKRAPCPPQGSLCVLLMDSEKVIQMRMDRGANRSKNVPFSL